MSADDVENEAQFKEKEVLKLICGRRTDVLDGLTADHSFMAKLSSTLRNDLILTPLNSSSTTLNSRRLQHKWIATMPSDGSNLTAAEMQSMADVRKLVNDLLLEHNPRTVAFFDRATRIRFVLSNGLAIPLKHSDVDVVQRGSVVQAFIEDTKALLLTSCESDEGISGQVGYFVVQLVLSLRENLSSNVGEHDRNICYAAVSRCEVHDGLLHFHNTGYTQILKLSDGVRRVCLVHACHHDHWVGCLSNPDSAGTCKGSIFEGNHYHFWGREQGYPPRMA